MIPSDDASNVVNDLYIVNIHLLFFKNLGDMYRLRVRLYIQAMGLYDSDVFGGLTRVFIRNVVRGLGLKVS